MNKNKLNFTRESICATCLTQDRKLYPARDHIATCFPDLSLLKDDKVCWECHYIVMKMAAFRSRVIQAQAVLADLLNGKLPNIKSLSCLSLLEPTVDFYIPYNDVTVDLAVVKQEVDGSTFDEEVNDENNRQELYSTPTVIPITYVPRQSETNEVEDTDSNFTTNNMTKEEIVAWKKRRQKIEFDSSRELQCEKYVEPSENSTFYNNQEKEQKISGPHAPSMTTPKQGSSKRPASPNPGSSKSSRRKMAVSSLPKPLSTGKVPTNFQIGNPLDSGSELDGQSSGEDDGSAPTDMRFVAKKLRELRILQEESRGRAVEEFLEEAGVAGLDDEGLEEFAEENDRDREVAMSSMSSFAWSEDFSLFLGREEEYKRNPGPNITCVDPLDIFLTIWDVSILSTIAQQTNKYAWEYIAGLSERGRLPKYLDAWIETNVDELRRFFGVLVFMSLSTKASVDEYWSTGILGMTRFRALMPRNRFRLLWRFLHFIDGDEIIPIMSSYEKRIRKITPVIEHLNSKFSSIYTPERTLVLDESLLLWKRLSWVQCIRRKTALSGVKAVELSEASSGYMLRCMFHSGNSSFVQGSQGFENETKILELLDGFLDVGHLVIMDNWYNQLHLARYLKTRGTDVLGTMNRNRAFVPPELKNADQKRMRRGEQISRHCSDISITTWKDIRLVTIVSTTHKDDQVSCRRGGQILSKPVAIRDYNKITCSLKGKRLTEYEIQHKRSYKWYQKVFFHLLNVSILNAYIVYQKKSATVLTQRAFRYKLAEALVESSMPVAVSKPNMPPRSLRLDGKDHYPTMTAALSGKRVKYSRRRCVRCRAKGKRSEVNTMCRKCEVALCIEKCFIEYHTLK